MTVMRIEQLVEMYIDNIYNYPYPYDEAMFNKKNEEIRPYVDNSLYKAIQRLRPYYDVIEYMNISKKDYNVKEVTTGQYEVDFEVTSVSKTNFNHYAESTFKETIKIQLNPIKIESLDDSATQHYATYQDLEDDYKYDLTLPHKASELVQKNINNKSIQYQFKGAPKDNPFESDTTSLLDSYNMVYWLYNDEETNLNYPLDYNSILNSGVFKDISVRHKYISDIDLLEDGDLLFFGKNNNEVGIYVGDKEYVTIKGKFPKDNTTIQKYNLEKDWELFNGKIYRLKDDYL
ncbi:putative peptidoglycan hydrolase [Staphylococcus phage Twort]|uniref:ORF035 n=2 Tax=Staphylococcus phage Twort (strain DSM 17442 / HER 48) TaxID=2908167 RepID=Q4Z9D7_BPTWO|nr:tail protein with lysin activity [Staphylococcus phage Twort]AAX92331.1 ORF035 [Staphylococcus phage Twort]QIW89114.1 putative peptidoglycan hydrolase [Staphylococcus phage Twort]